MNGELLETVERDVLGWPGVSKEPGRFNSITYRYGKREIGHLHRNGIADLPFTKAIHDELISAGKAEPHQAGSPGFVSFSIRTEADAARAVELFRMNYDRAKTSADRRGSAPTG